MTSDSEREFELALNVSRETIERLKVYETLLKKWNPRINLVSSSTLDTIWSRHFLDSAQIFGLVPDFNHWADLGSGGGFPGLVIAILAADRPSPPKVTLVESDLRKSAFLSTVAREIGLNVDVRAERIETIYPLRACVLSARALAPLDKLLEFTDLHLKADGVAVFPKGGQWRAELAEAQTHWEFELATHNSKTESAAAILTIKGVKRV
ncbi:16S rRNA (guanine(527)-N(7))-methyltransferase RsmG [Albirhodobacter sp. R86504]|uniref:16S rRNA (guanine(527)-N(7))-methyltransferase RsmG n=1 Tax=Albirhodobacter sp. R86504 TaxID=3093848 RepID=UPI00366A85D6